MCNVCLVSKLEFLNVERLVHFGMRHVTLGSKKMFGLDFLTCFQITHLKLNAKLFDWTSKERKRQKRRMLCWFLLKNWCIAIESTRFFIATPPCEEWDFEVRHRKDPWLTFPLQCFSATSSELYGHIQRCFVPFKTRLFLHFYLTLSVCSFGSMR